MITVADILNLHAIHKWELMTDVPTALSRKVINIGLFDSMPDSTNYADYLPGEFIISNMGFARDDPDAAEQALCAMLSRNLAAVAIRNVHNLPITDKMKEASLNSGTPLILYEGEYYEQVIFQAMKLLERDSQDSDVSASIDELISRQSEDEVKAKLYETFGAMGSTVQCALVRPKRSDETSLYAQIDELKSVTQSIKTDWERIETASVMRYHGQALVVVAYNRPPEAFSLHYDSEFVNLLKPYKSIYAGISEELQIGQGDIAIRQAENALHFAIENSIPIVRWASMLDLTFKAAATTDRMFFDTARLYQEILEQYDKANDTNLEPTARVLAQTGGEVKLSAELLFQHQNTVRYRMRKMKELFNMPDATDRELVRFLILAFLV